MPCAAFSDPNALPLNALGFSHQFIEAFVKEGDLCIDATAGRGRDTLFLAGLVGEAGKVLAFDIQKEAIESTDRLLTEQGVRERAELILDSHSRLADYAERESVAAIMFNFGWLPGGDHTIFSRADTSIPAIMAGMELLREGGVMCLCLYCGKECGYEEKSRVLDYLKTVDSSRFTVCVADFVNRKGDFPIPVFIIKRT